MDLSLSPLRRWRFSFYISDVPNYMTSPMYLNPCFLTFCHLLVVQTSKGFAASQRHFGLYKFREQVPKGDREKGRSSRSLRTRREMPTQRTSSLIPPMMSQPRDGYQPTMPTDPNPFLLYSNCSAIFPASP